MVALGPSPDLDRLVARRGVVDAASAVRSGDVPGALRDRVAARAGVDPAEALATLTRLGGRLVVRTDPEWPAWRVTGLDRLDAVARRDAAAPLALWVLGSANLATCTERAVAIVGTRAATSYGDHVTAEIAGDLAVDGWTVISGAAYGIDGAAHRAALGVGGTTVAVLACGVDRAYPSGHARLLDRIADQGAVVSEYPPGTTPAKYRFLARNRLVAALSDGVVVVEAGWRSGARNTASWARAVGRPVVAVPGPVTSASSAGCHRMVREGEAILVTGAQEVVSEIGPVGSGASESDERDSLFGRRLDALPETAALTLEALPTAGPAGPEEISLASGVPVAAVRSALVVLEVEGYVRRGRTGWVRVSG
ncbi:DNA-processing protein DprA [Rhodococcoides corynebacterioides]|uniref:DNA-protecting protein DprA n=1 Tax=Rhodococcoides corynebacterioides TaxID=53972 RepID=A0ABS7P4J2_9NOCA|nr:DNA-processing protein DprA [Rhodococcus corynebacterioides]MBY6367352.1 DNA-protecting protein DprA [Rhodococcus corynebacterioides]MBY6409632.1 DNA-protecting protein DprA [Rhodococcus corynebacterioides]